MSQITTSRFNFHICGLKAKVHESVTEDPVGFIALSFLHCEYCPDGVYGESCWATEKEKFPITDGKIEPYYFWTESPHPLGVLGSNTITCMDYLDDLVLIGGGTADPSLKTITDAYVRPYMGIKGIE